MDKIMDLNYTSCHYHPNKMAVTVCERCRRPICLEDKRIYRKMHTSRFSNVSKSYYTTHEYCILCYASQLKSDANPLAILVFLSFILIFSLIFGGAAFVAGAGIFTFSIFGLFLILLIVIIIGSVKSSRNKAQQAEDEAMRFKSSVYSNSSTDSQPSFGYHKDTKIPSHYDNPFENKTPQEIKKSPDLFSIMCFECGAHISLDDKFCPNCGDSTHDELIEYYKITK